MTIKEIKPKPNRYLVDWLRDLLARAESGELQGVAIACLHADNTLSNGWSGVNNIREAYTIIGQLEKVKAVLLDPIVTDERKEDA